MDIFELISGIILGGMVSLFVFGSLYLLIDELRDAIEDRDVFEIIKYGFISLVIVLIVGVVSYKWYVKFSIRSELSQHIVSYVEISPSKYNFSNDLISFPKIVIIDKNEKMIHEYHFSLPENRIAKKPTDVDVVVWLDFNELLATYYGTTSRPKTTEGYIEYCEVTVIDYVNNSIIATNEFFSTAPDKISYRSRGGPPKKRKFRISKDKIIDYIINSL